MRLGGSLARRRGARGKQQNKEKRGKGAAKPPRGSRGRMRLLAIAVALALVGWLGGYVISVQILFPAPPPPGDLFSVPNIRGVGLPSARERLDDAGLALGVIDSLLHPSVSRDLIVGQSPLPGQLLMPEGVVRVTISLGPQLRSVPDVTRLDEDRARIVLESSGFVVVIDTAQGDAPRGRIVEVIPPADSVVALPAEITIVVSTGPPLVAMPLLLGMGEEEAVMLLDSLGLVVSQVDEVFRFGRDQGIVVEQEPAAAAELERGTEVRLAVGRRGREEEQ